ncbi:unnamed protein product, partial [marine sediment metagenome]
GDIRPLSEKWVITISTQYGCSMDCNFCDVPKVGPGINATFGDLIGQIQKGIKLHPEVTRSDRLNVHFARMGEPTWNPNVLRATRWLKDNIDPEYKCHPVVSTMMPKNNDGLEKFIRKWMEIKNQIYNGSAGLQLSINSTNKNERKIMFNGNACTLLEINRIMKGIVPVGRKITLNFALSNYEINADLLAQYFSPQYYICKLTPMHETTACTVNDIHTLGGYTRFHPYAETEEQLKKVGYDVIVFVPSLEEDLSKITCGNAILAEEVGSNDNS